MINPQILDPSKPVPKRDKTKKQENWVSSVDVTTTSGKQYHIDRQELDWIKNRYKQDNADSYGYDTADQQAKAAGQLSAKTLRSYTKSAVDQQLAQMGLPSEKNLDKYRGEFQQWHTGGIGKVFGNNISSGQWTKMKDFYKQDWNYENTAEDQERKRRGLMPAALEKNYTDTEIDDQLKASGLPSLKDLDKYNSQYWNYKGIDTLYSNVAREWTNLRLRGIKNDGDDYLSEDKLTEKPGTQWYADAFFNELNRKDENGEDVYGNIKGLFKNRTTTTTEPDPSKDYVTELGKMVLGANKADALDEDFANYNAFSYDDFASHYDEYYDRDIKDLKVNETQTAEDALNVLAREEDEKAEKEFYTVDGKKAVKDFVLRYQRDYPDASAEKMFEDMYEHGLDDKLVKQAKKELQNEPGTDKDKVSEAYTAAKVKSGQFEKEQAQLWDNINYDPNDRDVVAVAKKAEEDANNKERVKGDRASLQAYVDAAIENGADEKTVADITAAIEKALSYAKDSDEGAISPNDVISVLNGISDQEWVDATAMQKALEDYGFGSNGKLSGDAAALAYNWSKQDIRKVLNSIGSVRYEDFELSDELAGRILEKEAADDIEGFLFATDDKKLDYEKFMHALDWANEQIANGMNEFDAYNTLAADGYQDELEAYLPEKWHLALYAHERVKEGYEAAKGDQLAWYEGLTDEEKYQHGLDIWNSYTPEQQADAFKDYNWQFDPAVYRTGKQAWAQQFGAIIPGLAANLIATPVKFADMISANLTGREKLWETTEDWMKAEATIGNWGKVSDTIGSGVKLADIAADATQEVARMMVLGTVGGAIGHGTKVGQVLSEVAGNEAAKWGVRKIAGFGLTMMTSSPFVVSATAGNFAEAKAMGASTAEATRYGLITGTLEGVLESLNFDELWGKVLGANSFGKMIMEGGAAFKNAGVVAKARIANMVASGLGEFMEESASYVAETFLKMRHADTWGKGTEWDANDWLAQAGMGFLTGMLGSGMSSGAITKDSLLYEYWNSNPATRAALMNTETATGVWNGLSATKQEKYRSGDAKVLSMDQYAAMLTQEAILDNTINAKAKADYDNAVAKANKKYNAVKAIENNLRAEVAALSQADPEYASKLAKLNAKITKAAQDSNDASFVLKDETTKAQNTYEQTISNSRQQLNDIHRQTEEHYAALYLQNESAIKAKDAQAVTENVSKDMQNGATVNKDSVAEQTAAVEEKAKAKAAAEPTVSSIREAAYNRVYKDEAIGKQAAGEAGDGSKLNGLTRVAFADSERNNFQAKTSARFRRVTLELAGLELAKDGMSAKEIFAEAKKAMTPEAAQKLDVYTKLSKALGLNMVIRDVVAGTSGYVQDGKLYVTLNGKQNLLRVASHELTHYMKAHAASGYDTLRTHLINELGGQQAFDEMLVKKAEEYGYDLNTEDGKIAVDDEVCAELCEKMLENKDALERFANKDMSAAQKLKARLGRTLVAIKSAIRSIGTSNAKSNSDLIKEQETVEAWYTALSSAIDAANNSAKTKAKPTTETATETEATTAVTESNPEANEALYMGEEDARREQLKSDLEKLAEKGTKVKDMKYAEVNELLDSVVLGDEQNYDKADYARVRGMLAQLIPDIVAYTNGDENVDMEQLNEKLNAAVDYMLGRYYEANSDELTALREAIPNKISLTETAYKDLREAKEMTLREASRELSRALGKPVTLVYKRSPDYNNAEHLDTLWGKMENGLANGKPSFAEDVTALIGLVTDAREAGRTTFDDLYGSQREDVRSSQVGEFLDAVQSMVEGKNDERSSVRFTVDSINSGEALKDASKVTRDDAYSLLESSVNGDYNYKSYIPVRGNTPKFLLNTAARYGSVFPELQNVTNRPLAMNVEKAVQAIEDYDKGYAGNRDHGLGIDGVLDILDQMENPQAVYWQTDNGRLSVVVKHKPSVSHKGFAVVDFENYRRQDSMAGGYPAGVYNIVVTEYGPDSNYLERYESNENNVKLYDKENGFVQLGPDSVVAGALDTNPMYNIAENEQESNTSGQKSFEDALNDAFIEDIDEMLLNDDRYADEINRLLGLTPTATEEAPAFDKSRDANGRALTGSQQEYFADSKVRSRDGQLRPVYHYTNGEFTEFVPMNASKGSNRTHGDGYYVSTSESEFSDFGKNKMTMYANITNPFEMELTPEQAESVYDKYAAPFHPNDKYGLYREHAVGALQTSYKVFDYLKEYAEQNGIGTSNILRELGFDGVHDGSEWVAFDSNQLKFVDNENPTGHPDLRFDLDDDYMPLAERYDAGIATEEETAQLQEDVTAAAKASMPDTKIVNEEGNPRVVYHGTSEKFTVFDRTKGRSTMDIQGMFFSPWEIEAGGYGENVGSYYLNIQNPAPESVAYSALRRFQGQNNAGIKAREYLAMLGYDGVDNGYDEYIAFYPNQIKSADLVTYDDDGNIIPLNERFNPNETDIRNMLDDDWDALIQQYGAKPQGREPRARDVQVPNRASDKLRVSDFTRSLDESSKVNDELSQEIHSEIASEAEELKKRWAYIQKSNDETMRSARDYIAQKQPTEAKQEFHDMVVAGQYSLKTEAIGLQLLADAAERNDWQAVKELAIDLRVLATDAGQRTQLFNILKDLKGVGSAWYIESLVKKLNNWYADDIRTGRIDGPITVSEEAMNQVRAAKTQAEVDAAEAVVAKEIAPQLPLELSDKLSNWRYLSMLGNPVTHIRNVTGNTLMAGMSSIKDVVAAGVQRIVEKTGLANESDRSHALLSDADKARWENFVEQSYEEQRKNLQGGGKLGFQSTLQQNKRSFDNKYLDAIARGADPGTMSEKKGLAGLIENIRNNGAMGMLEVEDAWGLRRAYKKALMERMVAQGYTLNGDGQVGKVGADGSFTEISQEDMNKAIEWATNQAWTATFRGPSQFASMLNKISKMNTASKLIVEGVMPFKKTPINIAKTGAMYSPAGVAIGVGQLLGKVRQGKMSAAQAVDNLASGLTGSALLALGAMLAKAGILRAGGEDKKRYETYLEDTGDQTFSLKFGDYSIDLSAIAPATIPLFMGVALQEALGKNGGDDDDGGLDLSTIVDVAAGTLNPFMEMSFMSSLNSALKNYNNEGIGGALGNTILTAAQNYGSQYLPTIGGKVAQFVDPTRRTTKSSATSPIGSNMDYYVRSLMKKVPGVEATLQPDVDVWGRTNTKDSFGDWALDFANKFILPTTVKVTNRDAVDNELIRIVESTGEVDFLPSDGAKYFKVKGETYKMNAKQYTEYSQERGQAAYAALKEVMMSPSYQAATDGEKYNMLKKAIDAAYKQVNTTWKEKLGAFDK